MNFVSAVLSRLRSHKPSVTPAALPPIRTETEPLCFEPGSVLVSGSRTTLVPDQGTPPPGTVTTVPPRRVLYEEVLLRTGTKVEWDQRAQATTVTPACGTPMVFPQVTLHVGPQAVEIGCKNFTQRIEKDGTSELRFYVAQYKSDTLRIAPDGTASHPTAPSPATLPDEPPQGTRSTPAPTVVETPRGTLLYAGLEIAPYLTRQQIVG